MRRGALAVCLAVLLGAQVADGQHAGGAPAADVPPGPARIHGRILRPAGAGAVGEIDVVLYALPVGGAPGLRRTRSAPDGSFAFEQIANDPETAYLVGARVGDIPFPGARITFEPGQLDREVEIHIAEPTSDASAIAAHDPTLRIDWTAGRIVVTETHRLENGSDRVFFVPVPERDRLSPAFRTALPPGASDLTGPLGILPEGLAQRGDDLAFFGPVYPGSQDLVFSYALAAREGTTLLRRRFPGGSRGVTLLVPERGPTIAAPGLTPAAESVTEGGRSYRKLTSGVLRPGAELALAVTLPAAQSDPATLSVEEVRAFLEQDDAALTVRESHRLVVAGDRQLVSGGNVPLYRISIPERARDIRFATEPPGIALLPSDDGGLVVAGPLAPGASEIEILYHVPVTDGASRIVLGSSRAVPLLSVFVADTGLDLRSERLHRRRPARTEDRTYLHLEAFELEPGEEVTLDISRLVRARGAGRSVALAGTLLGVAGIAALLVAPLRRARTATTVSEPVVTFGERDAIYAAMRDLEEDFETGKVSASDHALLRDELRGRAAELLRAERDGAAPPASPLPSVCTKCGVELRAGDRFCGQCGTARVAAAASAHGAQA